MSAYNKLKYASISSLRLGLDVTFYNEPGKQMSVMCYTYNSNVCVSVSSVRVCYAHYSQTHTLITHSCTHAHSHTHTHDTHTHNTLMHAHECVMCVYVVFVRYVCACSVCVCMCVRVSE